MNNPHANGPRRPHTSGGASRDQRGGPAHRTDRPGGRDDRQGGYARSSEGGSRPSYGNREGGQGGNRGGGYGGNRGGGRPAFRRGYSRGPSAPAAPVDNRPLSTEPLGPEMDEFKALGLSENVLRALRDEGYTTPTPIQAQGIPAVLSGRDVFGCAQTGTGKTAAFTLPLLQRLADHKKVASRGMPRAVIMAPTRELASQIAASVAAYGRYYRFTHTTIFGGVGFGNQINALQRGVDILVATPGRLLDLMQQRHVSLAEVEVVILDEADRMLDMGFIHDIRKIIATLPSHKQSLFFSATLEPAVRDLARTLVRDPVEITIEPEKLTVERINQTVYFVEKRDKDELLVSLLADPKITRVVIFTQMKHVANKLADILNDHGIRSDAIHGNKSQAAREQALAAFRAGKVRVLVATDIAARGIDVDGISHVINYELPREPETYVHRIGRTARAGADGDAITLCMPEERDLLRSVEKFIRAQIPTVTEHKWHSQYAMDVRGQAARQHAGRSNGRFFDKRKNGNNGRGGGNFRR